MNATLLTLHLDPEQGEPIEIRRLPVSLGRKNADIVIPDDTISSLHAVIEEKGGGLILRDVGSTNGSYVNGKAVTSAPVRDGDVLRLGEVEFTLRHESVGESTETMLLQRDDLTIISLPRAHLQFDGERKELVKRFTVIGRSEGDIAVDDQALSRRHFELELLADGVMVKDLGSSNGTFREGTRIRCERFAFNEPFTAGTTAFSVVREEAGQES